MKNFWQTLEKPIMILAPMEDVTDSVFRCIVATCGRPTLFFTEFTNVDGFLSEKGSETVGKRFLYTEKERPLIAQIWGENPEHFYLAAKKIVEMGFDGIDINMGCPEKSVTKKGLCSALINNPQLAHDMIQATKEGAGNLPISVKTRIGFNTIQTDEWVGFLLKQNLEALIVHGRTAKEMSEVPAHWDEIEKARILRDQISPSTILIGNGDVETLQEARQKAKQYNLDGIMIGRGIFKDPWLFNQNHNGEDITMEEKAKKLLEHVELFEKTWGKQKHFPIMKKFFKCYVHGIDGAAEIRTKLMECNSADDVKKTLESLNLLAHQ